MQNERSCSFGSVYRYINLCKIGDLGNYLGPPNLESWEEQAPVPRNEANLLPVNNWFKLFIERTME